MKKTQRTRIKICGLSTPESVDYVVAAGADALGFVFYPPSVRAVSIATARTLARRVAPFVSRVGLFVNPRPDEVRAVLAEVPLELLQFHGDEAEEDCLQFGKPYIKALRVRNKADLLKSAFAYPQAQALLLDAPAEGYGGGGASFDWSLIPRDLSQPIILAGGLNSGNVAEAIARCQPYAVDVSSGVEAVRGVKDKQKIQQFINGVRHADERD